MPDKRFYFLHIPKTAGTSFTSYFSKFFKEEEIFPGHFWFDIAQNLPFDWEKYQFYRGHFGYSLKRFLPKGTFTLTFLRDPIERVISHHHHASVDPHLVHMIENRAYNEIEGGDLKKMLQMDIVKAYYWNMQSRFIGVDIDILGDSTVEELASSSSIHNLLSKRSLALPESELLGKAITNLKSLDFVGIQEYFEQSCLLLAYKAGLPPRFENDEEMKFAERPSKEDFDKETIEELRKLNHLDYVLYELGKKEFLREYKETIEMLAQSLRRKVPDLEDIDAARALVVAHQAL